MNTPKKQHYIPQFYLKFFCDNGYLWVYDRNNKEIRKQPPKTTAFKKHYYSVTEENGDVNTDIEKMLAEIESKGKIIIEKLNNYEDISIQNKEEFSLFLNFMFTRVPAFEKQTNELSEKLFKFIAKFSSSNRNYMENILKQMEKEKGEPSTDSVDELIDFIQGGEYSIKFHRDLSLMQMLTTGTDLWKYFLNMDWVILHSPKNKTFITNDNPFMLFPPANFRPNGFYGYGIMTPGASKCFPLTTTSCLLILDWQGDKSIIIHKNIDREFIRTFNLDIARFSTRFLFSCSKALLESLVKRTGI